eukprot:scaffold36873_cov78-Phaeocystis_antarctica.AAC.9
MLPQVVVDVAIAVDHRTGGADEAPQGLRLLRGRLTAVVLLRNRGLRRLPLRLARLLVVVVGRSARLIDARGPIGQSGKELGRAPLDTVERHPQHGVACVGCSSLLSDCRGPAILSEARSRGLDTAAWRRLQQCRASAGRRRDTNKVSLRVELADPEVVTGSQQSYCPAPHGGGRVRATIARAASRTSAALGRASGAWRSIRRASGAASGRIVSSTVGAAGAAGALGGPTSPMAHTSPKSARAAAASTSASRSASRRNAPTTTARSMAVWKPPPTSARHTPRAKTSPARPSDTEEARAAARLAPRRRRCDQAQPAAAGGCHARAQSEVGQLGRAVWEA